MYVRFTVRGQDIVATSVTMLQVHLSPGGVIVACNDVLTSSMTVPISSSSFTATVHSPQGTTTVRGMFTSLTDASGAVDEYVPIAPCPGYTAVGDLIAVDSDTWQAAKQ